MTSPGDARLEAVVAELTAGLRAAALDGKRNEAAFRKDAEAAIERAATQLGVELRPEVEFTIAGAGFADAVYNRFVIEWEAPGAGATSPTSPPATTTDPWPPATRRMGVEPTSREGQR